MKNKKEQLQKMLKNERGLTLVELLAVIVILGIIGTIAFVTIGNVVDNSKKDTHITNAQQLISAAKLYEASGEDFSEVTADKLHEAGFIEEIVDPWDKNIITMSAATVTKDSEGVYSVVLPSSHDGASTISATEEELRTLDRDEIFNPGGSDDTK